MEQLNEAILLGTAALISALFAALITGVKKVVEAGAEKISLGLERQNDLTAFVAAKDTASKMATPEAAEAYMKQAVPEVSNRLNVNLAKFAIGLIAKRVLK